MNLTVDVCIRREGEFRRTDKDSEAHIRAMLKAGAYKIVQATKGDAAGVYAIVNTEGEPVAICDEMTATADDPVYRYVE